MTVPTRAVLPRWWTSSLERRYRTMILVSRETFTLRLFKRLKLVKTYRIAVGRAGLETPAGFYEINDKQVNPSWHVPLSAWAGPLAGQIIPPGPADPIKSRWLGFYNGAGIHGTADTWSLGSAASHGCVRMAIPDVEAALRPRAAAHADLRRLRAAAHDAPQPSHRFRPRAASTRAAVRSAGRNARTR